MAEHLKYGRVLLKISGESLCSPGGFAVQAEAVSAVVDEIAPLAERGVQVGLVSGAQQRVTETASGVRLPHPLLISARRTTAG